MNDKDKEKDKKEEEKEDDRTLFQRWVDGGGPQRVTEWLEKMTWD